MITKPIGLYIHIPFCVRKCNYCDFCSYPLDKIDWKKRYINRLCWELRQYRDKGISIDSIFFGGGTPSLLSCEEFGLIVSEIFDVFDVSSDAEFTIEVNPKTVDKKKFEYFVSCGVNRISIGLQSIHENEMKILGRIHNYNEFLECFNLARDVGIKNINVDLMYGIPEQSIESFDKTLSNILSLSPEHISLYGLIIEEETPFGRNVDLLDLPGDDAECDMYDLACERLKEAGYLHYEISNYAKEGYFCKHNLKYWHDEEYIGVGIAAHSYYNGRRFGNCSDVNAYLDSDCAKYDQDEVISRDTEAYEFVMLGLRLSEGFSLSKYKNRFGVDFLNGRENLIHSLVNAGYILISDDRISLTERGFYVSNLILNELI